MTRKKLVVERSVKWLRPYIKAASKLVDLSSLRSVSGYKLTEDTVEVTVGRCWNHDNKWFAITLATHLISGERFLMSEVLQTLAHEVAHIRHWDHTPDHWELESQIVQRFAEVARSKRIRNLATRKYGA